MTILPRTVSSVLAAALLLSVAPQLRADEMPADLPLIDHKLHPLGMKFELSPMYHYSLNDKYTHHTGFQLIAGFNLSDSLSFEAFGGYNLNGYGELNGLGLPSGMRSGWTSLTKAINQFTHSGDAPDYLKNKALELPDLYYQTWFAGADVMFSPFYGKWSIVSELGGSASVYGILGAGAAGTNKDDYKTLGAVVPGPVVVPVHYGLGTRIYLNQWLALRVELRDYWWINPEVEEVGPNGGADPCVGGYCLTVDGTKQQFMDFSRATFLQAGLSFLF